MMIPLAFDLASLPINSISKESINHWASKPRESHSYQKPFSHLALVLINSLAVDAYGPSRGCIIDDEPSIIAPITTDYCSLIKLIQPLGSDSDGFTSVRFSIQTDKLLKHQNSLQLDFTNENSNRCLK